MKHAKCYKKGYPRPRFVRENFTSLDGEWDFAFDDENAGERKKWHKSGVNDLKINVPFAYQCALSGINVEDLHKTVWYSRTFTAEKKRNKRLLINFEGADHEAKVWLNGELLGTHAGGYARFTFDLTDYLKNGENLLVVKCVDRRSPLTVRGKQRYVEKNISCFYTDTTGIWKPVWLEEVGDGYLSGVSALCNYAECEAVVEYKIQRFTDGLSLETRLYFDGEFVRSTEVTCDDDYGKIKLDLTLKNKVLPMKPWSAGRSGQFFDVEYILKKNGKEIDRAGSYVGLVDYRVCGNEIQLNYLSCLYMRMVLDQGYFEGGDLTAPSEEALTADVELIKRAGFNGVRIHQKIEDERFYYYCDMLGLYFWLEMPAFYDFTSASAEAATREWAEIVNQYKGYLSLMAYVPVNESWGVLQTSENEKMQAFTAGLYYLTKSLDPTRLVISNDGWEHTISAVATLHNYAQTGKEIKLAYSDMQGFMNGKMPLDLHTRSPYADGFSYGGQPVIISEYGGVAYAGDQSGWGYGESADSEEEYINRVRDLTAAIVGLKDCQGYCYTQFTDVMQEQNGLFRIDRSPKIAIEKMREINGITRSATIEEV